MIGKKSVSQRIVSKMGVKPAERGLRQRFLLTENPKGKKGKGEEG